jgi:metal-responsive CopG/Arc/MetJ family transcriptional regulator
MERIPVYLPKEVVNVIEKTLKGKLGRNRSEIVRKITIRWLSEQGYIPKLNESSGQTHEARKHHLEDALKKLDGI